MAGVMGDGRGETAGSFTFFPSPGRGREKVQSDQSDVME
jgi:hypothetical protein